ncbi:hypothetical protein AB4254_08275 [Vibrio breoganii]
MGTTTNKLQTIFEILVETEELSLLAVRDENAQHQVQRPVFEVQYSTTHCRRVGYSYFVANSLSEATEKAEMFISQCLCKVGFNITNVTPTH